MAKDLTGKKFGKLTAVKWVGYKTSPSLKKERLWECVCDCGKVIQTTVNCLTTGNTKSCGCYKLEVITKHGGWKKSSYNTWRAMIRRCYVETDKDFPKYGRVGVIVQDSWLDYLAFEKDMGEPEGAQTLHRVDPYGNYTKENCIWASPTRQAREIRVTKRSKTGVIGVRLLPNGKYLAEITLSLIHI